ncbi:hypothetical protein EZJ43_13475 [Pedobacter changchengzhani]|uniref:Uncharacterized protein n=1 Tax=Pedobacter changchengzhani TaxID=2529274 RepID=A0A4R5MJ34_9SPHI|nr:hypothetical protein [Pedobacter changchengzhani]TDG35624.1 hypothetical protein EZJ43_13475 [Pedobacter changchengzhani]
MEQNSFYATEVWLISGIFNSLPGILKLDGNNLVFTAIGTGTYWQSGLKNIERKSGNEKFCALLKQNKPAQLFNIDLGEIQKLSFPFIYFSAGAHITLHNQKYRLSFIEPNNTKLPFISTDKYEKVNLRAVEIIQDISHARAVGKKWKALLPQL